MHRINKSYNRYYANLGTKSLCHSILQVEETDNDKDFIMLSVGELKMVSYFRDGMCSVFFHLGYPQHLIHTSYSISKGKCPRFNLQHNKKGNACSFPPSVVRKKMFPFCMPIIVVRMLHMYQRISLVNRLILYFHKQHNKKGNALSLLIIDCC